MFGNETAHLKTMGGEPNDILFFPQVAVSAKDENTDVLG